MPLKIESRNNRRGENLAASCLLVGITLSKPASVLCVHYNYTIVLCFVLILLETRI